MKLFRIVQYESVSTFCLHERFLGLKVLGCLDDLHELNYILLYQSNYQELKNLGTVLTGL